MNYLVLLLWIVLCHGTQKREADYNHITTYCRMITEKLDCPEAETFLGLV